MYAIVVQGRFVEDLHARVTHLLSHNPKEIVIVSLSATNSSLPCSTGRTILERMAEREERLHLLYCTEPPLYPGLHSRNLQRKSTFDGICLAQRLGCSFVLKTRTDHLFRKPNIVDYLMTYLAQFNPPEDILAERIMVSSAGTVLTERWGKYHICDFWCFGMTEDLLEYFACSASDGKESHFCQQAIPPGITSFSPEPDFVQKWMQHVKLPFEISFQELLGKYFVLIDNQLLDYIYKGQPLNASHVEMRTFWDGYYCAPEDGVISSSTWYSFYSQYTL